MARNQEWGRREDRWEGREDDERRRQEFGSEGRGDYRRGGNVERDRESWRGQSRSTSDESDRGGHERYGRDYGRTHDEFGRERGELGHPAEHGRQDYGRESGWGAGSRRERGRAWNEGGRPWGESGSGRSYSDEGSFSSSSETERPWGQQGGMGWGPGSYGNPPGMTYGGTYGGTSPYGGTTGMGYYGTRHDRGERGNEFGPPYGQSTGRYGSSEAGRGWSARDYGRDYGRHDERGHEEHEGFFEKIGDKVGRFFGKGPKNYKRSDERVEEEVNEMLFRDPHVDASEIEVEVHDGEVTLSGTVDDRTTKRMAEDCVWNVTGVRNVTNLIRVERREYLRDDEWSGRRATPGASTTGTSLGGSTTEETRQKRAAGTTTPATGTSKLGTSNTP